MLPKEKIEYTLEQYLELDHESEEKIEFWNGHVFTLAGVSEAHGQIEINLSTNLTNEFRKNDKKCRVFPANIRVKVPAYLPYRYPDLSALCGQAEFEKMGGVDLLVNPQMIVEILSESTADFDRGYKFTYYKSIESFTEYILIAQDRPYVSQFIKQSKTGWLNYEFNNIEDKFYLESVGCEIELAELYTDVEFPEIELPRRLELI